MEPTIYIDVLFFVTWGMDAFLLWAAGRIAGFRGKNWRILLGGLLSAVLYCGWLCLFRKNGGLLLSLLLLTAGTAVAFSPKRLRNFLRLFGAALLASFLMGGGVNVLFTMTQAQRFLGQGIILRKGYPWWLLPWSVVTAYLLLKWGGKWMESHIQRRREFCTATVRWRGKQAEGRTLIDTPALADLKADCLDTIAKSRRMKPEDVRPGFWGRLLSAVLRVFAPLM